MTYPDVTLTYEDGYTNEYGLVLLRRLPKLAGHKRRPVLLLCTCDAEFVVSSNGAAIKNRRACGRDDHREALAAKRAEQSRW